MEAVSIHKVSKEKVTATLRYMQGSLPTPHSANLS